MKLPKGEALKISKHQCNKIENKLIKMRQVSTLLYSYSEVPNIRGERVLIYRGVGKKPKFNKRGIKINGGLEFEKRV